MSFTEHCNEIFNQAIRDYHVMDNVDTPISNPYDRDSIENRLYLKCWIDTVQWHLEDLIRDPHLDAVEGMNLKHRIDRSNQDRTDLVEQIDSYFRQLFCDVTPNEDATINTESPAWAIDRLSILALKIYHMKEQTMRTDASKEHLEEVRRQALHTAEAAEGPLYGHRPAAGRHQGRTEIHEGVSADEDV